MRIRVPAAVRAALVGGLVLLGLQVPMTAAQAIAPAGTPFACVPKFYQVSGGTFQEYHADTNSFTRIGSTAVNALNGVGYRPSDNYVYGVVSNATLYRLDAAGTFVNGGAIAGVGSVSGGDFYHDRLLGAPSSSGKWSLINVDLSAASAEQLITPALADNGYATGSAWGAYDLTVHGDVAYGLNNQSLYIATLTYNATTHAVGVSVAVRTILGPTNGNYGAAYSDSSGNAFFFNNSDSKVYMLTAAQLTAATQSATAPTATLVGGAAANLGSGMSAGAMNDGASCPEAVSPYTPTVAAAPNAPVVTDTTAILTGSVNPNNTDTTTAFCVGTDSSLETCDQTVSVPGTLTGHVAQTVSATVSDLLPGTTYYYRVLATNIVGTNPGPIDSFTTSGVAPEPELTDQTITFTQPNGMTLGGAAQTLTATASSELPVSFTSQTTDVCTVSDGVVRAVAAGACTIAADQAGDTTYAAAPQVTRSFTVEEVPAPAAQTVTFEPFDDITFGDPVADVVASASSGLPVTITSSTPTVCSVDGRHVVALTAGICELTATQAGDETHAAASPVSRSFVVAKATRTVHLAPVSDIKLDRGPAHVVVTTSPAAAAQLDSSTPQVCTLGAEGAVNLVSAGTCTVTASVAADETHTSAYDTTSFEVLPPLVVTAPAPVAAPPGGALDVSVPASGGVAPYRWTVSPHPGNRLPDGLVLDGSTGRISGTPTRPGDYTVLVTVTDSEGEEVDRAVHFVVASRLTGSAPSGRRTVVAGGTVRLPDHTDDVVTWSYRLPTALTRVRTAAGRLVLRATTTGSGTYDLPLTVTDGVGTQTGVFRVTVRPRRVPRGSYHLEAGLVSEVAWKPVVGVDGYRVYVGDELVGRTEDTTLSLSRPLGPKSLVTVRAVGHGVPSEARRLTYTARAGAPVAGVVYFDTDRAGLDRVDTVRLRHLARAVRSAGFRHVGITGYTDSRGSDARNQGLSERRAQAVRAYLRGRLQGLALTWKGRAEHAPAASNATPEGMALNRRVEVRVW